MGRRRRNPARGSTRMSRLFSALLKPKQAEELTWREINRPLSPAERALLEAVLTHQQSDLSGFVAQLDETVVTSECSCGCASITLHGPERKQEVRSSTTPLRVLGHTDDDHLVDLFIYTTRRQLSSIYVCCLTGDQQLARLPKLDSLFFPNDSVPYKNADA